MKGYLFDTHIHTMESSSCSEVAAADIVARYKKLGYDGIIVTDHVSAYQFKKHATTYEEQSKKYMEGYTAAKKLEDENFHVIQGMEIRFLENDNDYLLYVYTVVFFFCLCCFVSKCPDVLCCCLVEVVLCCELF